VTTEQTGRVNQKERTRAAIVDATRDLMRAGGEITMPSVAQAARVSEATAYRYFPDLVSLLREAVDTGWPTPAEAFAPLADVDDPVRRVAHATEFLLRRTQDRQGAVRAMIAASIGKPPKVSPRPGHRFGLIDEALAPVADRIHPAALAQLRRDLAIVVSAEALFTLTDLCGLDPDTAIASAVSTARTVTEAAIRER
jgi:AcrR family transcriptional regulator